MHPELEILLQIQDLKTQRSELAKGQLERELQREQFKVDVDEAIQELDQKIENMEDGLSTDIRGRYDRIAAGRGRAVVPVINEICYGCFVSIPTSVGTEVENQQIRHCDNCGRFIYVVA